MVWSTMARPRPVPCGPPPSSWVDAEELAEDAALVAPGDADAVVADADDQFAGLPIDVHFDPAGVAGVLDGVVQQVLDRPFHGDGVGFHDRKPRLTLVVTVNCPCENCGCITAMTRWTSSPTSAGTSV